MSPVSLNCPKCGNAVANTGGRLLCTGRHVWNVVNGIPRFVDDESNYAAAFGLQWQVFRKTQLDSYTGLPLSRDRLRRCMGDALWRRLAGEETVNVLEVGCGAGRFTEILLDAPQVRVESVDYSAAVEANQSNCPQGDAHRVVQADVRQLPFAPRQFDIVICLGTIQHTPNPEQTLAKLYEQVRPGGALVLDHYTATLGRRTAVGQLLCRLVFRRMTPAAGLRWTKRLVALLFPLHRAAGRHRMLDLALTRLSPVQTYFHHYPQLDDRLQYEWSVLDTHDLLTDWYKHMRSASQIERTLSRLGAVGIEVGRGGNGVEARCYRPS